jgi:hypothetical protein
MSELDTYTVPMLNQTIVADATLVIIHTHATATSSGSHIEVLRCSVSQMASQTGQQLGVIVGTKASAFGTYTSTTPVPTIPGTSASGIAGGTAGAAATAGTDASAEGAGTVTPMFEEGFDNRAGWLWIPTEEERPKILPDQAFILKLVGTPTSLVNWNAHVTFREVV